MLGWIVSAGTSLKNKMPDRGSVVLENTPQIEIERERNQKDIYVEVNFITECEDT